MDGDTIIDWSLIDLNPVYCSKCVKRASVKKKGVLYCKKHLAKAPKGPGSGSVKSTKLSFFDLSKRLVEELDKRPHLLNCHTVVLENQPVIKNPIMKSIQMRVYSYYLIRGVTDGTVTDIQLYYAKNKIEGKSYADRKKNAIRICKEKLTNPVWIKLYNDAKKKDDLADSYLQGLSYQRRYYSK